MCCFMLFRVRTAASVRAERQEHAAAGDDSHFQAGPATEQMTISRVAPSLAQMLRCGIYAACGSCAIRNA